MTDAIKPDPVAGWYPDAESPDDERYWNGDRWTDARRPLGSGAETPSAGSRANGFDIAAVLLAIFVGPVGLAFGLISVSKARKAGSHPSGLAIAASVIGGFATIIGIISAIVTGIGLASAFNAASDIASIASTDTADDVPLGEEPQDQVSGDPAEFCAAYAQAEPALSALVADDFPSVGNAEWAAYLSPLFEDAYVGVELMMPYAADVNAENTAQELLASADDVRAELADESNIIWIEIHSAEDYVELLLGQAQQVC